MVKSWNIQGTDFLPQTQILPPDDVSKALRVQT